MHAIGRLVTFAILLGCVHVAASADIVGNASTQTIALPDTLGAGINILAGARRSDDCDDIRLIALPMSGLVPGIRLRTGPDTWGKKVEILVDGNLAGTLEAPGNRGTSAPVPLVPGDLYKTQLNFVKPKAFGALRPFYQIVGLGRFAHQDIEIVWQRDHC